MSITPGSTSRTEHFRIVTISNGTPAEGLTVTGGEIISAYYKRDRQAAVEFSVSDLVGTSYDAGGVLEEDSIPGIYRLDVPDAAYATGASEIIVALIVASAYNCQPIKQQLEFDDSPIAQTFADDEHTWRFDTPTLIATNRIEEYIGFDGIVEMDFDDLLGKSSITNVESATLSGSSGVTVNTLAVHPNRRKANVSIDTSGATAGTYITTVKITTSDSREFLRQGRLTLLT